MLILVILLGVLCTVLILYLFLSRHSNKQDESSVARLLKSDIDKMNDTINQLRVNMQDKISERLDKNQAVMLNSLQRQFSESSKLIAEVTRNLTEIKESNKQVVSITDELKVLQNVLSNPKQRGVLGEYYLKTVLENVLPPGRFGLQYKFKDGEVVDAVIFLEKDKILPIDSKFSLENYNRFINESDKQHKEQLIRAFKNDIKSRIDETAKYIRSSENTMDFAFMFIPSEAIYYDLLNNQVGSTNAGGRDLIEYAFRDKKVIIVSPSSFMAYLQTVLQGLRGLQIEEKAKDIQVRVSQLGRHIMAYEQFMQKLGNSLGTTVGHYNNANKELSKIDKDVYRITGENIGVEPVLIDRPQQDD